MRRVFTVCVLLAMGKLHLIVIAPAVKLTSGSNCEAMTEAGNNLSNLLLLAVLQRRYLDFNWLAEARFEEGCLCLAVLASVPALAESVVAHGHDLTVSCQEQRMV